MTAKFPIPPKDELESKYLTYGVTGSSLAKEYNVSGPVLRSWFDHHNIKRKTHQQASTEANNRNRVTIPPKELLESLYQTMSLVELQRYFKIGQATIYQWLTDYNIPIKTLAQACKDGKAKAWNEMIPTKEEFTSAYEKTPNLNYMSELFNLSGTSIKRLVKEYDIEVVKPWRSNAEIQLFDRLVAETNLQWSHSDKTLINPFELDIVCHGRKIAIEYCGLYWHSENNANKAKDYHLKKLERCLEKGYNLITVFESDPIDKIVATIKQKLGFVTRVHGRQTSVIQLDSKVAAEFNNQYHLHGHMGGTSFGLYKDGELLMVLTMGKSRFNKSVEWECVRMTVRDGYSVLGGASKLFHKFIDTYDPSSIITYADRRFGEGLVYEKCGFTRLPNTPPNYFYFNPNQTKVIHSRVKFQKHKLKQLPGYDPTLTEWQIMVESGYDRIWDCGNAKYVWERI